MEDKGKRIAFGKEISAEFGHGVAEGSLVLPCFESEALREMGGEVRAYGRFGADNGGGGGAPPTVEKIEALPWQKLLPEALPMVGVTPLFLGPGAHLPQPAKILSPAEAHFIQSVILAIIYTAAYWALKSDTFGNSTADLAALLITSFALDLTVEAVLKLKS